MLDNPVVVGAIVFSGIVIAYGLYRLHITNKQVTLALKLYDAMVHGDYKEADKIVKEMNKYG